MYFILKIMVYKWTETRPPESLWISKLGISNYKLSNLKVVLATHDSSLFNNQNAKQNRLFIKFLRESILGSVHNHPEIEGQKQEISRSQVKQKNQKDEQKLKESKEQEKEKKDDEILSNKSELGEDPENEGIADVYLRIFAKFQVNSMDSLLALWKEQIESAKDTLGQAEPPRHLLLDFLSHNPTLSKISQMTIVLNLSLSQFFSAITNSRHFLQIQEHYDPEYSKPRGWFASAKKPTRNMAETRTNLDVNFGEACILSYVYSVLKNISLDKKRTQEIILTKKTLRKSWFQLIGEGNQLSSNCSARPTTLFVSFGSSKSTIFSRSNSMSRSSSPRDPSRYSSLRKHCTCISTKCSTRSWKSSRPPESSFPRNPRTRMRNRQFRFYSPCRPPSFQTSGIKCSPASMIFRSSEVPET